MKPYRYWTFDGGDNFRDKVAAQQLSFDVKKCPVQIKAGQAGKSIDLQNQNCLISTNGLSKNISTECSIEFLFKGNNLFFLTYGQQHFIIQLNYPRILFRTSVTRNGKVESDDFVIHLKGAGKQTYNYYADDQWHHLVFMVSTKTGRKEIWVDGELPEGFSKTIPKGLRLAFGGNDGFRNSDQIDEIAFYNAILPPALIQQHALEAGQKQTYSFTVSNRVSARQGISKEKQSPEIDPLEFAPGYPNYTVQAIDQLRSFPLPRYRSNQVTNRNFSWMDISYLHRELAQPGGIGFGKTDPSKAVQLTDEMVQNWNYYIEIPCVRGDSVAANKIYGNKSSLHGALIQYANSHPQYPWATIVMQAQNRGKHAGFDLNGSYILSQNLPAQYYLRDASGKPVLLNGRKMFSPLMPLDIVQKDGQTTQFYLRQLLRHVKRPPAVINENGEVFGHIRPMSLLQQDPRVKKHMAGMRVSNAEYSGWFQYRLDSCYKAEIMKLPQLKQTKFSFYNTSAFNPAYWPDYKTRRKNNEWLPGIYYPTPDFYPSTPDNWRNARGPHNGYGTVARGRKTEIELGDKLFSPFVSAGWGKEENNIRPAQWLALLKALVMLGADFFYVGYFNVTGAGGKWPNGAGPNDPRGYAYQVAMPAYAQAMASQVRDFITKGQLLNPADPNDLIRQFRFAGKTENELILVRKLGKEYLIYGSIQPNSNFKGNVPLQTITEIKLEGKSIRFPIRKQGSMYVLNLSGPRPVFYQIDAWHEYKHPWYWSKDIEIEAELPDNPSSSGNIRSEQQDKNGLDFSGNTAYFSFQKKQDKAQYTFRQRTPGNYYCYLRARSATGKEARMRVYMQGKENRSGSITVNGASWKWYQVKVDGSTSPLQVPGSGDDIPIKFVVEPVTDLSSLDVDKLSISKDNKLPSN